MLENLKMINLTAKVFILGSMVKLITEIGKMGR
jgi:hypothetical protein